VIGDDELRAVLHGGQHSIAASNSAMPPQKTGEPLGMAGELGVGQAGIVILWFDEANRNRVRLVYPRRWHVLLHGGAV
jgi:hypothetical protein